MTELPPLLNQTALLKLGWTPGLITAVLQKPDLVRAKKRGIYSWVEHVYARDRVLEGMRDPRFVARIESRKARAAAAARRQAEIPTRYATWKDALPEACAGMFSLNRYAKHRSCSPLHKVEIYRLKNELIEVLYREGYSTATWIHRQQLAAQICRECGGAGGECDRCGDSGIYREGRTLQFWCFQFRIADKFYCWHQPAHRINFMPIETVPPQDWQGLGREEKPVRHPMRKFVALKALLRWVIDRAGSTVPLDAAALLNVITPPALGAVAEPACHPVSSPPSCFQDTLPF